MKKKSGFGLIVALLTSAYAGYYWAWMNGYFENASISTRYEAVTYGVAYGLVKMVMQDFVMFAIIAAAVALVSYFAAFHIGYLASAGCLVYAFLQLPSEASPSSELGLMLWGLCILLIIAFAIDQGLRNRAARRRRNKRK